MGQPQQQGKKSKKEKKVVPVHVHNRHTIDMTRERKAKILGREIRKSRKKLAKRRRGSNDKLRAHIADLKVMQDRLERHLPAEVRTRADYAPRYRPNSVSMTLREALRIRATTAPTQPSPSEAPAVVVPPPATPDPAPAS